MRPLYLNVLFVGIGLALGGFVVELIEYHNLFIFDARITLGEFTNAVSTILAAVVVTVLVTHFFEKHNQTDRKEKDLLLRQLDFVFQLTQEFEKCNESGLLAEIIASHKRLAIASNSLYKILEEFRYKQAILNEANFKELTIEIWKLATETPIRAIEKHANRSRCSTTVKAGIINLAAEKKTLLEVKINELKSRIFRAQLILNRKW